MWPSQWSWFLAISVSIRRASALARISLFVMKSDIECRKSAPQLSFLELFDLSDLLAVQEP